MDEAIEIGGARVSRAARLAEQPSRTIVLRLRFADFARVTRSHTVAQAFGNPQLGGEPWFVRITYAAQKAYEYSDRLTDRERYIVTAAYHAVVTGNVDQQISAYRTVLDGAGADDLGRRLREGRVDLITFTASSTVRNFVELVGTEIGDARVVSIGPITSATARELGLPVHAEAEVHSIPGLLDALTRYAPTAGE